jgi:membrane-anchored mycosin MYCP
MSNSRPTRAPRRAGAIAVAVATLFAAVPAPPAAALKPWVFNPAVDIAPPDGPPGPDLPMKQSYACAASGQLQGSQFDSVPLETVWGVRELHGFSTGRGQTVAVIDSGVNRNERLPRLLGGGDYIGGSDGLSDCDHHGTLVAGIVAAQPRPGDGFVGIAPDSSIISIRQTSEVFRVDSSNADEASQSASNLNTLARAIVHAAAMNATVINISVTSCLPINRPVDLHPLAGALYYAAVVKNAVVVTSTGNINSGCTPNPGPDPAAPSDPRGWSSVTTLSLPSMFSDFVLSVGGTSLTGDPYVKTMPGPWVGVAAPAINVVSLDPSKVTGELVNAQITDKGPEAIAGTSFASAAVAGLAALIRQRYPELTAHQVIERIRRTARSSSQVVSTLTGSGVVDPMAALTGPVDLSIPMVSPAVEPVAGVPGAPPPPPDNTGRNVALAATVALGSAVFVVLVVSLARGGRRRAGGNS